MAQVAAAYIENSNGEILICKRGGGGSCAYLWEFPGGKREGAESLEDCLKRELYEELSIECEIGGLLSKASYLYPEGVIEIYFFRSKILKGEPKAIVHEKILWAKKDGLEKYEFCPADYSFISEIANGL